MGLSVISMGRLGLAEEVADSVAVLAFGSPSESPDNN
jgi:hypothetical protein